MKSHMFYEKIIQKVTISRPPALFMTKKKKHLFVYEQIIFFIKNHTRGNNISAAGAFYKQSVQQFMFFDEKSHPFYENHKISNNISAAGAFGEKNVQEIKDGA